MIMHNAANPITERIEYATDVQIALDFSESRRALRVQPRQSFTYTLLERTKSLGVMWWRSRQVNASGLQLYPWLPSAVCVGRTMPVHILNEYQVGAQVFVIGRESVGVTTVSGNTGGIITLADTLPGKFIAPAVIGYCHVGDVTHYGGQAQGAQITVHRKTPIEPGVDSHLNTFTPDGATDITDSTVYRESSLDFTGSTTPYRDFHTDRTRIVSAYSYVFGKGADVARFRSMFMRRKGRLETIEDARRWVNDLIITSVSKSGSAPTAYIFIANSLLEPNKIVVSVRGVDGSMSPMVLSPYSVSMLGGSRWGYLVRLPSNSLVFEINHCPHHLIDRRLDQDTLEITHIAPGVARSSLIVTDL